MSFHSGDVVTMECVEKLIKKDMMHPLTSVKLKEKDIIEMQRVCFMRFERVFLYFQFFLFK